MKSSTGKAATGQRARLISVGVALMLSPAMAGSVNSPPAKVDFNKDIRPILTENCYKCHGPDDGARKAKLRFDLPAEALKPAKSGSIAIVPGAPEKSELVARITATDADDRMPPAKTKKTLTANQIELLRRWIAQGAPYATHWAYVKPKRPALPAVKIPHWPRNPVDRFILARLEREGLTPAPVADRYTLIRRLSLDLTGIPPTVEEVDRFAKDRSPAAYEHLVDRLLQQQAFGEHWARMWLDLARYADSAGYADDPPRTIWAYRDYVIKAFNANKPFDRFTLEQIAADLLDDADEDELTGTAFHRNTMTNNEGGTSDEEFRNAAVVDRVNTTMAVWMGTSIACAQCHNHKYDPISQKEYFQFFALFNNSADADLKDESPVLELYTPQQKEKRTKLQSQITEVQNIFKVSTPESLGSQAEWEKKFPGQNQWLPLEPISVKANSGGSITKADEHAVKFAPQLKTETYTVELAQTGSRVAGLRLEIPPSTLSPEEKPNAGFSLSRVSAMLLAPSTNRLPARYVRLEIPGEDKILSLAEVQVFHGKDNLALKGEASQSSTAYDGPARFAIDGNTNGNFDAKSTTHTERSQNPWWEVDLKDAQLVDRITIWNRTDSNLEKRLEGAKLELLDEHRKLIWLRALKEAPEPKTTYGLNGSDPLEFSGAFADATLPGSDPKTLLEPPGEKKKKGWVVNTEDGKTHYLTLLMAQPLEVADGSRLQVVIEQTARHDHCPPTLLRVSTMEDERLADYAAAPDSILEILSKNAGERSDEQRAALSEYYRANIEPAMKPERGRLSDFKKQLAAIEPNTVPIMRELAGDKRRKANIQFRGNYLDLGEEVSPGVPVALHPLPAGPANRLALARWLVDTNNPLTARVLVNRLWEQIFGAGIVRTCEEFGSQGELPSNPELLDWLACELRDGSESVVGQSVPAATPHAPWDIKGFLKLLVTSAAYQQSSRATPQVLERDPENLLLSRGPRFRVPAEVVRDQALAVSGLLSSRMYGPPVRPPRPNLGLSAAFGGSLDWKTSDGEDRYRRALYVEWRRTSPYPSMAAFDAPNREVCSLRRTRSNTPLQALVTLNDPVYIEAAEALGKRMATAEGSVAQKIQFGFRVCLARPPQRAELRRLVGFFDQARAHYLAKPDEAKQLITFEGSTAQPALPKTGGGGGSPSTENKTLPNPDLAAWTAVGNVLLNLDETLMRR